MTQETSEAAERATNFTATKVISGAGKLLGIFVASTTGGTIKVADKRGTIVNTFTAAAATWYRIPVRFVGDLTITVANTIDATAFHS